MKSGSFLFLKKTVFLSFFSALLHFFSVLWLWVLWTFHIYLNFIYYAMMHSMHIIVNHSLQRQIQFIIHTHTLTITPHTFFPVRWNFSFSVFLHNILSVFPFCPPKKIEKISYLTATSIIIFVIKKRESKYHFFLWTCMYEKNEGNEHSRHIDKKV